MRGGFETGDVAWFPDGYLNVSVNCLDRHPPEQTAIIWEGDSPTDVLRITCARCSGDIAEIWRRYGGDMAEI